MLISLYHVFFTKTGLILQWLISQHYASLVSSWLLYLQPYLYATDAVMVQQTHIGLRVVTLKALTTPSKMSWSYFQAKTCPAPAMWIAVSLYPLKVLLRLQPHHSCPVSLHRLLRPHPISLTQALFWRGSQGHRIWWNDEIYCQWCKHTRLCYSGKPS
jgi:hypothetical protein